MHLGEPIFIFILAFVLLGPKKTSELAQQIGKLMAEFRKASNDFKYQFNEEMRVSNQQEQQRKQEAERAALTAGAESPQAAQKTTPEPTSETLPENRILPPGEAASSTHHQDAAASEAVPYSISAVSATTGEEQPVEDHPLLRVDVIPPMDGSPADQTSPTSVTAREEDKASVHHG